MEFAPEFSPSRCLARREAVTIRCRRFGCGHETAADLWGLVKAGLGNACLVHLSYDLRCGKCGTTNAVYVPGE
jgi:hypothetical protein